jgi:hypothetical protein
MREVVQIEYIPDCLTTNIIHVEYNGKIVGHRTWNL